MVYHEEPMKPSPELCAFTKHTEGLNLKAYWDVDGYSIGYGYHGPEVTKDLVWTKEQAEAKFQEHMDATSEQVSQMVKVPLTQGQFDCLCDFAYNVGCGALRKSTLLAALNQGRYAAIPSALYRVDEDGPHGWVLAGGKVNHGLVERRVGEIEFWNG